MPTRARLDEDTVQRLFDLVAPFDPGWVAAALLRALASPSPSSSELAFSPSTAHLAVDLALKALDRQITTSSSSPSLQSLSAALADKDWARVDELCREDGEVRGVCRARRKALDLGDRVMTWEAIWGDSGGGKGASVNGEGEEGAEKEGEDDGWGDDLDLDLPPSDDNGAEEEAPPPRPSSPPPSPSPHPSLPLFLSSPLPHTALLLALSPHPTHTLPELALLCTLHAPALYPHRVRLVEAVPEWVDPGEYRGLLPAVEIREEGEGHEAEWEDIQPWRASPDWSESLPSLSLSPRAPPSTQKRSPAALSAWYASRATHIASQGLVAPALALVQHAASRGVNDGALDELGEELSLLSRLVYDRPARAPAADDDDDEEEQEEEEEEEDLTLPLYRSLSPAQIVALSLRTCTPANLAPTIRRLVLPYLGVLESRAERAREDGRAAEGEGEREKEREGDLTRRLLNDFVLSLATSPRPSPPRRRVRESPRRRLLRLHLLLAVFESSKPTLRTGERIVKDDGDLARLAVAGLYGFYVGAAEGAPPPTVEEVVAMGKVLECLPAFDTSSPSSSSSSFSTPAVDLFALASSSPSPTPLTPPALFSALTPPPPPHRLTSLLDTLDLHLSQLESLHRYACAPPAGLAWFLTSYRDARAQREWATRLARTAAQGGTVGAEGEFEGEDEWVALREFMVECTGVAGEEGEDEARAEKGLGRAFWMLGREEALRIFFGGLLGAGRFSLARSLFSGSSSTSSSSSTSQDPPLDPAAVEELVVSESREFYDNAEDGNLHRGEMKLAYECLSAAPHQSPLLRAERSFIEATSRLCSSYRLTSPSSPSLPLTPIELRHAPDRLAFIAHLLSTTPDAGRHPEVVLELVRKLGYPAGGKAEVRVLAMLAERATDADEWTLAGEMCDRAAAVVDQLRKRRGRSAANLSPSALEDQDPDAAAEYAWKAAFHLGKQGAWADLEGRKNAVGQALVLCPPERIAALLPLWTELERDVAREQVRRAREEAQGSAGGKRGSSAAGELHRAGAAAVEAGAAKVANFLAAAASSAASGVSPSPSPLSATFPSSPSSSSASPAARGADNQQAHHTGARDLASEAAEAASRTLRSAAAYLPSFAGVGGGGGAAAGSSSRGQSASPSRAPGGWSLSPQKARFDQSGGSSRPATPSSPSRTSTPSSPPPSASLVAPAAAGGGGGTGPKGRRSKLGAKALGAVATPTAAPSSSTSTSTSAAPSQPVFRPETPPHPSSSRAPSSPPSRFAAAFDSPPSKFASAFDSLSSSPPPSRGAQQSHSAHPHLPRQPAHTAAHAGAGAGAGAGFSGFGLRAGLSNKLTAGVGWLIADTLPHSSSSHGGPISLTLALGTVEGVEAADELMDWEEVKVEEAVKAVRQLRETHEVMQVDLPWEVEGGQRARGGEVGTVVVVDTNILISHLALLRDLVQLVASSPSPSLTLLIPHIVLLELDGLKTSSRSTDGPGRAQTSISSLARAATNWLLAALKSDAAVVRGQRKSETLLPLDEARSRGGAGDNDTRVLDAALFFREREQGVRVVLLSDDNNLRLRATVEGVEATGVGAKADAQSLLEQLGMPLALSPSPGAVLAPSSRFSPPRHPTSPPSSRKRPSPPRRLSLPPVTRTSPLPLPSTISASASMELDPPTPPPTQAYLPLPLLVPVSTRADVFRNLSTLLTHFIALPLFRHAFEHLKRTRPDEQRAWQEEMGDWRLWGARECVEACRRWWVEGDLEGLCRVGLEQAGKGTAKAPTPPPRPPPPLPVAAAPKQPPPPAPSTPSNRGTSSSRWATPASSSRRPLAPAPTPSPASPPLPPPPLPSALSPSLLSRPSPLPVPKQLSSLHSSLTGLSLALSTPPDQTLHWSAPRFEVLLEEAGKLMAAVLGGTMREDVSGEVERVVQGWVGELQRVGVRVEVRL
ncbi:hypothetical protein JCM6882_002256 [Rhodosporidiobolus microsporus]